MTPAEMLPQVDAAKEAAAKARALAKPNCNWDKAESKRLMVELSAAVALPTK